MFNIKNDTIFRITETQDGYDLYKLNDDGKLEMIAEGLTSMDVVRDIIEEEA
jgi:hypothetical protein